MIISSLFQPTPLKVLSNRILRMDPLVEITNRVNKLAFSNEDKEFFYPLGDYEDVIGNEGEDTCYFSDENRIVQVEPKGPSIGKGQSSTTITSQVGYVFRERVPNLVEHYALKSYECDHDVNNEFFNSVKLHSYLTPEQKAYFLTPFTSLQQGNTSGKQKQLLTEKYDGSLRLAIHLPPEAKHQIGLRMQRALSILLKYGFLLNDIAPKNCVFKATLEGYLASFIDLAGLASLQELIEPCTVTKIENFYFDQFARWTPTHLDFGEYMRVNTQLILILDCESDVDRERLFKKVVLDIQKIMIFSVGVILFELMAKRLPFKTTTTTSHEKCPENLIDYSTLDTKTKTFRFNDFLNLEGYTLDFKKSVLNMIHPDPSKRKLPF